MTPEQVHPSHDVREEGILISDPVCQICRASVYGSPERLLFECLGERPTIKDYLIVRDSAIRDIATERARQVEDEGWSPAHDDQYQCGELAAAAACYAVGEMIHQTCTDGYLWPWGEDGWKPSDRRRELVKAGALIIAEIERLDRAILEKHNERG